MEITIALVMPSGHEYSSRLTEGVLMYLEEHPGPRIIEIPYRENAAPEGLGDVAFDGAILWTHRSDTWVHEVIRRGVRLISCNAEWTKERVPGVGVDGAAMVRAMVGHLAQSGRRHVAHVGHVLGASENRKTVVDRFFECARKLRMRASSFEIPGTPCEERSRLFQAAREVPLANFLKSLPLPASVLCENDFVGVLTCAVARQVGIAVPDDLAVMGVGDTLMGRLANPSLTTQPVQGQMIGYTAMRLLIQLMSGQDVPVKTLVQPAPIILRESTGRASANREIQQAYQMIQESACKGLTVDHILQRLNVSQKTLNKRFAAAYGRTPGVEIRRVRAERACQWLSMTDLSIGRISELCGFSEQSNFNIFFRRETGCSPRQYRLASAHQKTPDARSDF